MSKSKIRLPESLFACLLVLAWVCSSPAQTSAPPRFALVIGNSNYVALDRIKTPESNIAAIRAALIDVHFSVTVHTNLDRAGFSSAIINFVSTLPPDAVVFVYFSGYAIQDEENNNWLLPVDFAPTEMGRVAVRAIGPAYILNQIEKKKIGPHFLVLDGSRECAKLPLASPGLATIEPRPQSLIALEMSAGSSVADPEDGSSDLFTRELAREMRVPSPRATDVFDRVQEKAQSQSGRPEYRSSSLGDFTFVALPAAPKPEVKPGTVLLNPADEMNYVWVPKGHFMMGCVPSDQQCAQDELPRHHVEIPAGFWMTWSEVTVSAYQSFAEATGRRRPRKTKTTENGMLTDRPVTKVNWEDANAYCKRAGGSLPTEEQWEYAARGGNADQIYPWGDVLNPELVNSFTISKRKGKFQESTPARHYRPNGFFLGDMAGNAREWTADVYDPSAYSRAGSAPPPLPRKTDGDRVVRGGSWNDKKDIRTSARAHLKATEADNQTGFRCVVPNLADASK